MNCHSLSHQPSGNLSLFWLPFFLNRFIYIFHFHLFVLRKRKIRMCNHTRWLSLAILLTGLTMIGSQTSGTGDATLAPTELPQAPPTTIPPPPRPSTAPILPPVTPSPRQDRLTTTTPRVTQNFARLPYKRIYIPSHQVVVSIN